MELSRNSVLITGGASGLGAATAELLAGLGAKVTIADRNKEAAEALKKKLGGKVQYILCDVTNTQEVQHAVDQAASIAPLVGLVNCAGIVTAEKTIGKAGSVHDINTFIHTVQINLVGTFNMVRLSAATMAKNTPSSEGERGVIVNTASIAAFDGQVGQAAYAASKGGIVSMTLPLARDLARDGIRVMTIAPGIFWTPMMESMPENVRDSLGKQVPFPPRLGKPNEFAQLVRQIFENIMLNGETIRLDGAIRMAPR